LSTISGYRTWTKRPGNTFVYCYVVENRSFPLEFPQCLLYSRRYKYFRFGWPYFRLSLVFQIAVLKLAMVDSVRFAVIKQCVYPFHSYSFIPFNSGNKAHKTTEKSNYIKIHKHKNTERQTENTQEKTTQLHYKTRESWRKCITTTRLVTRSTQTCVRHSSICHQCIKARQTQINHNICETVAPAKTKEYFYTSIVTRPKLIQHSHNMKVRP